MVKLHEEVNGGKRLDPVRSHSEPRVKLRHEATELVSATSDLHGQSTIEPDCVLPLDTMRSCNTYLSYQICLYFSNIRAQFITSYLAAILPEKKMGRNVQSLSESALSLVLFLNNRLSKPSTNPWDQSTTHEGRTLHPYLAGKSLRDELITLRRFPNNESRVLVG